MHYVFNTEVRSGWGITLQYLFACRDFWLRWPAKLTVLTQAICTAGAERREAVGRQLCDCRLFKKSFLSVLWEVSHILTKLTPASAAQRPVNPIQGLRIQCATANARDFMPHTVSADMRRSRLKHFPLKWKLQSRLDCRILWKLWCRRFQFHLQ